MEDVENNKETTKLGGITGKGFMPGVSGNPGGRPKGTLKDYVRRKFMEMSDEEKIEWLEKNKIAGIDQWKMGEGNPKQDVDAQVSGEIKIAISEDIATKYGINASSEGNS